MKKIELTTKLFNQIKNSAKGRVPIAIRSALNMTKDNLITNAKVLTGKLPRNQMEVFPQKRKRK
jgi:hypothetical protein